MDTDRRIDAQERIMARALAAHRAGQLAEAAECYRSVLESDARNAEALHLLGVVHDAQGEPARAAALIESAIALYDKAWYRCNYAMVLGHLGRHDDALAAARWALALRPDYPEALNNLGVSLAALGDAGQAIAAYERAVAARPGYAEAWTNLGHALRGEAGSEEAYRRALALRPDSAAAHGDLGNGLRLLGRHGEAETVLRRAVALGPTEAGAYKNLALVLDEQDRPHEALAVLDLAIGLHPGDADAHHHRAMLLLRQGRFTQGWAEYDWRFRISQAGAAFKNARAPWRGEALQGRTILLAPEQGLGDTIQFCRYAPMVAARGGRVLIGAPRPLAGLLRHSFPGISVIAEGETVSEHAWRCPLLSLPRAFATTAATVPAALPYLAPPPELLAQWRERLPAADHLRAGIVWAGNPNHLNDRRRSLAFAELAPLWDLPDVRWHSLQVGARAADLAQAPGGKIEDLAPALDDFAQTAAAILRLDVVVTPDTAVAHLAGALGVPALVMLPFAADWRWIRGQDTSPWYPGMRLIRQDERRCWKPVIGQVAVRLDEMARQHRAAARAELRPSGPG